MGTVMHPLDVDRQEIAAFCRRWKIRELALFGSALRGDFSPASSDVDLLVTFDPDTHVGLGALGRMDDELTRLFNRPVDLVERAAVEAGSNEIRKRRILDSAQVLFDAER